MSSKTPFILSFMAATAATVTGFAISFVNREDQLAYQEMLADPTAGGGPFDGAALEMVIAFWLFLLIVTTIGSLVLFAVVASIRKINNPGSAGKTGKLFSCIVIGGPLALTILYFGLLLLTLLPGN